LLKAKKEKSNEKLLLIKYAGDTAMSADIANGLKYIFPEKIIVVIYTKTLKASVSARGNNVREIILKAISELKNATGGGHENAAGAQIMNEDIEKFENKLRELIK